MRYLDSGAGDWALKQFDVNRHELAAQGRRRVGFGALEAMANGAVNGL
jgi:hypothetical protein